MGLASVYVKDAEETIIREERNPGSRADLVAEQGIDGVELSEIGDNQHLARGGDAAGKALPQGNDDLTHDLGFRTIRRTNKQAPATLGEEKDGDIIHAHDVFDGVEQGGEEGIKVGVSDGGLDERQAQTQFAREEGIAA